MTVEYRVSLSGRALRDLAGIYDFVKAETSEAGRLWFKELEEAIYSLEQLPERGKSVRGKRKRRQLLFGEKPSIYRILYDMDRRSGVVKIFHVRHGARS